MAASGLRATRPRISREDLFREPFRIFFPLAVLAALVGISLWPLMLGGWISEYPGPRHARLMVEGFFGGFIFGFLGTSMPRLLESRPLGGWEVVPQAILHVAAMVSFAAGSIQVGDVLFLTELAIWVAMLARRFPRRQDLPPPGFVLMPLAFGCAAAGIGIDWLGRRHELPQGAELLARLLGYHGFVLLCVMGAGSFLLPRFLGLGVREKYPTSRTPTSDWVRAALASAAAGGLIVLTLVAEAAGWALGGAAIRVIIIGLYLWSTMPLERLQWTWNGVQWFLVTGLVCTLVGVLACGIWPGWRVALSHIELIGGFGLITLGVGTRVVFGHSGQRPKLERFHPWLTAAAVLMLMGLVARVSGDILPQTMLRHYNYAAACWSAGLVLWAACVLPGVLRPDPEA